MPRAIVIDDNTSVNNGHYNELSSLLLGAAIEAGYQPVLAAHQEFRENVSLPESCQILRVFSTRRMTRWSCGFDGQSSVARDTDAAPLSHGIRSHFLAARDEWLTRAQWRPSEMIKRWSEGLNSLLETLNPDGDDKLIFQTADDFMMVAMARTLSQFRARRLCIKAIFHYAVQGTGDSLNSRAAFDQQLNHALQRIAHHDVQLYATTEALADQMNGGALSQHVHVIPYPIRKPTQLEKPVEPVPRLVLGGVHRVEQGRDAVSPFLEAIYEPFVKAGRCSLTLRLDPKNWRRIVPRSLQVEFEPAIERQAELSRGCMNGAITPLPALDVQPATLSEPDYYRMLSSADMGVLLYDADRYKVRCSGILLEFLTRGVPVIVPDNCWLSSTLKAYGDSHALGYSYRDAGEIAGFIEKFLTDRPSMQSAAQHAAHAISVKHSALTTFQTLMEDKGGMTRESRIRYAA